MSSVTGLLHVFTAALLATSIAVPAAAQTQDRRPAKPKQEAPRPVDARSGPVHTPMKALGFKTDARVPEDFVTRTRPAAGTTDYIPVGRKPGDRAVKIRDKKGIEALEAEMAAANARQAAARAAAPPPGARAGALTPPPPPPKVELSSPRPVPRGPAASAQN